MARATIFRIFCDREWWRRRQFSG